MSQSPPKVEYGKSVNYRTVPMSVVWTALRETEGKLLVFFDRIEPTLDKSGTPKLGKIVRELQVELHFSPQQYKALADVMTKVVKNFEKKHKIRIKAPEKPPAKALYG